MFANFGIDTVIMIVLAAIIGIYLYRLEKKEKSDPLAALCKDCANLSADRLLKTSDDELVRTIIANILSKTDKRRPDVSQILPSLSYGQIAVYAVWLVCHELESADVDALLRSPSAYFVDMAAEGFALIGAEQCADTLICAVEEPGTEPALRDAIATEQPLSLCVAYIRKFPEEFTDL